MSVARELPRSLDFHVPGRVGSKGSHKPGKGKLRNDSKLGVAWEKSVAEYALLARSRGRVHKELEPPYCVTLVFVWKRPVRSSYGWPVTVDIDKAVRATLDGLATGGILCNDRHVTELHASAEYGSEPGCHVIVRTLDT